MSRAIYRAVFAIVAALTVILTGCDKPSTFEVTGTVTLDGQPLSGGRITLVASDGLSTTAAGDVEGGTFRLSSTPGAKIVKIEKTIIMNPESDAPYLGQAVPRRYNSETTLKLDVTSDGPNHFEFSLTSDSP